MPEADYLKSNVKFPQPVMTWGAMSSAGVGPLCFPKSKDKYYHLPGIFHGFFCWQAYGYVESNFHLDLVPAHTNGTCFNQYGTFVTDWQANYPDLSPLTEPVEYCQEEDERL